MVDKEPLTCSVTARSKRLAKKAAYQGWYEIVAKKLPDDTQVAVQNQPHSDISTDSAFFRDVIADGNYVGKIHSFTDTYRLPRPRIEARRIEGEYDDSFEALVAVETLGRGTISSSTMRAPSLKESKQLAAQDLWRELCRLAAGGQLAALMQRAQNLSAKAETVNYIGKLIEFAQARGLEPPTIVELREVVYAQRRMFEMEASLTLADGVLMRGGPVRASSKKLARQKAAAALHAVLVDEGEDA